MKRKTKLITEPEYGQTPWDNLSREELLYEVRRMYSAIVSLRSCMGTIRSVHPTPYWTEGSGYRAMLKAREALGPLGDDKIREQVYNSYFRYADTLLFDSDDIGYDWMACDKCDRFGGVVLSKACPDPGCDGVFRPLEWSDLAPEEEEEE